MYCTGCVWTKVMRCGFVMRQWVKYQRQSLKHQKALADNVYYRNINNNAGIFDHVIPRQARRCCDGEHGKVERAAAPEFPVGALPSVERIQQYFRQNFIRSALEVVDPVVVVQIGKKDFAFSGT